ncbi:MAG: hypothetical protein ABEH81_02785, partial [Halopenitus sp.]
MTEHHVPKGVSLETLKEVLAGWAAVGAASEPQYTSEVESVTELSDTVGRQTRFLEDVGALAAEGQKHRLTEAGDELASALAVDEEERAKDAARDLLSSWDVTRRVRGLVRGNPLSEDDLVDHVITVVDEDHDSGRVRSGVSTLLEFMEWAELLNRDLEDRYRLPADATTVEGAGVAAVEDAAAEIQAAASDVTAAADEAESVSTEMETVTEEAESVAEEVESVTEEVESVTEEVESVTEEV